MSTNERLAIQSAEMLLSRVDTGTSEGEAVHGLFALATDEARKLEYFLNNPDPKYSDVYLAQKIESQRSRTAEALKEAIAGSEKVINSLQASQRTRQLSTANLVESEHSAEIRAVFRGLDRAQKLEFIDAALKADDKPVIAALTNPAMSPLLIGLPADELSRYREHYLDKFLPKDDRQLDNLRTVSRTFKATFASI